jgi:hypothetical protein
MKKLITIYLIALCFVCKGQETDTLKLYTYSENWAYQLEDALIQIDKKLYTEYFDLNGKSIPLTYNTPIISYYRGVRKKVLIQN